MRERLKYDPETGAITCRLTGERRFMSVHTNGYLYGKIAGQKHYAHRIAWLLANGEWPSGDIDHINGDRTDNRALNLRDVPHALNQRNMKRSKANSSGFTGVVFVKSRNLWQASVKVGGRNIYLGRFVQLEDAALARRAAEAAYGFHPNHGRVA
jgi:hypothetical protein